MTQPRFATAWTLGVAIATVTSALALEGASAGPQDGANQAKTVVKEEAKPAAPAAKAAARTKAKVSVKAVPAPKAVGIAVRPNADGQAQQYMQQFRPILRAEYHIVRVVCRPDAEQRKAIARDGEQTLREAASKYVDMMRRPMTVAQRAEAEPRRQIRAGLAKSVKARLPAEMVRKYEEEIAKRDASRKQLAVRNLVARLDRDLVLSPDQRDKIAESLGAHWDDSWCQSIEMFMYDYQFLPPIPDQYVAPFLNDPQKGIWRGIQKVYGFWGGFGMMGGIMVDDPLEDEELKAARLEAARGDPNPAANQPMGGVMLKAMVVEVAPAATKAARPASRKKADPAKADATKEKAVPKP